MFLRLGNLRLKKPKDREMDVLWIVNTNTFLLVILIIMNDFLSHNAGQCSDPFFEKGIAKLQTTQKAV